MATPIIQAGVPQDPPCPWCVEPVQFGHAKALLTVVIERPPSLIGNPTMQPQGSAGHLELGHVECFMRLLFKVRDYFEPKEEPPAPAVMAEAA